MSENNKAIALRFFEAFKNNDQTTLEELLASDMVIHVPGMPGPVDRETHLQGIGAFHTAFSDLHVTIDGQIAERDTVATRLTWGATQTGDFRGLAASGKQFAVNAASFMRIKNGKVSERWFIQDDLGQMQQLGALPPPE
jgi:steroid delta-isomerase-like uncharacterized protein